MQDALDIGLDAPPIVQIGHHAIEIGRLSEELGNPMIGFLVKALILEVGRMTAHHLVISGAGEASH
ncbi:hypothetical protein G3T14_19515 [Methylobacterium sp. BTF04]|uniref:hypothetical protein n=1 Tax=Methylobacterium sp. BTF04 TaxID=2708300 RepID=UPI0013D136AB|nr:hypothetical protein [Methylobacterium sp. BTF04]NEU14299.1 hypothetical protein [Methylobacterium sp. BTF04]